MNKTAYKTEIKNLRSMRANLPRSIDGRIQYTNEFRKRVLNLEAFTTLHHVAYDLGLKQPCIVYTWRKNFEKLKGKVEEFKHGISVSHLDKPKSVQVEYDNTKEQLEAKRMELLGQLEKVTEALKLLKELGL